MVRKIAWKMQALAEGDLSERARRRAEELARGAELRVTEVVCRSGEIGLRHKRRTPFFLTPSQANNDRAMIPKYPSEGGQGDKARKAINVQQAFDFCHADIVTEVRSIAISIFPDVFQGIRALKDESYPLKFTKSQYIEPAFST